MIIARRVAAAGATVAAVMVAIAMVAGPAHATDLKVLGFLKVPHVGALMAVCTDPVVQNVLSDDLALHKRAGAPTVVTVTVNTRVLTPGVSLGQVSPGDPSVAGMLKDLGAEVPAVGNAGDSPADPYAIEARRENTMPDDPMTAEFRNYQASNRAYRQGPATYDNLPPNKLYDTAIVARASIAGSPAELKVVAVAHPGDDVRSAKKLVAEAIANAILH